MGESMRQGGERLRQGKEEKDTDSHRRRFYENMFFREKPS